MKFASITCVIAALACATAGCADLTTTGDTTSAAAGDTISTQPMADGVAATSYPEAAALNMYTSAGVGYACSATLIAPRVLLTAGHCVDGFSTWEVYIGTQMQVSTRAVTYDWHEHGVTAVDPARHDIGLVFLSEPIVIAQYPALATTPVGNGSSATDVGRIHDGEITTSAWESSVTLTNGAPYGYPYDYEGTDVIAHGDSGGPVFVAGTHDLIAVNSGAGEGTEVVARVDLLHTWIDSQVAANGGFSVGSTTPTTTGSSPASPTTGSSASACVDVPADVTSLATAGSLSGCVHGDLPAAATADYLTFNASAGTTYTLRLTTSSDAVFTLGAVTAGAHGDTCAPIASGQTGLHVSLTGTSRTLCVVVTSPHHTAQAYTLTNTD